MEYSWNASGAGLQPPIDAITFFRLEHWAGVDPTTADETWWSVMIELGPISIADFEQRVRADFPDDLVVPAAYDSADRAIVMDGQLVAIFARQPLLNVMNRSGNPYGVTNVHLGIRTPLSWLDFHATPPDFPRVEVGPETVVMALIDDGLGIAHELFRATSVSTRVEFCAVLAADPDKQDGHATLGRFWNKEQIDRLLVDLTWSELLDEELFYSRTGQTDFAQGKFSPVSLRRSHGTHVMGLAAGFGEDDEAGADRPIICAVLPPAVVEDTSGVSLLPSLCLALQMLSKKGQSFRSGGEPSPLVLSFSYGNFSGPHDGTSEVARLFEQFVNAGHGQKRWMALPAGNGNLMRSHGVVNFDAPNISAIDLDLRVLPDDRTATHVEMWMPYSDESPPPNYVTVIVTSPFGCQSGPVEAREGQCQTLCDWQGKIVARLLYTFEPAPTARGLITLVVYPTASLEPGAALAPSGRWKITTEPGEINPGESVEVWIRRDETLPGYRPGGRQAFFDNAGYKRFGKFGEPLPVDPPDDACPVHRAGTLSGFAEGPSPMVIAAFTKSAHRLSDYSAAGPVTHTAMTPQPARSGPDASAEGDHSTVQWGVLSAGSRSGSYVRLNGTSVAAPRVARRSADAIKQWPQSAREWVACEVEKSPFKLIPPPDKTRTGRGGISIEVDLGCKLPTE